MADGCYYNKDGRNSTSYCTISPSLARQIKHILRRLRINFGSYVIDRNKTSKDGLNRQPQHRFELRGDIVHGIYDTDRQSTNNVYIGNNHYVKIKDIKEVDYNDSVWNVEVEEDHTITTKIGVSCQCEGFGVPLAEVAGCGVSAMAVDYSAMSDVVRKTNGIPLKVKTFFREMETQAYRAYPDNKYAAEQIYKFLMLPKSVRKHRGYQARKGAEKYNKWDNTAKTWEN